MPQLVTATRLGKMAIKKPDDLYDIFDNDEPCILTRLESIWGARLKRFEKSHDPIDKRFNSLLDLFGSNSGNKDNHS